MNVYHKSFCPLSIQISFWEQNTRVPPLSPVAPAIKFGKLPRVITDESKKNPPPGFCRGRILSKPLGTNGAGLSLNTRYYFGIPNNYILITFTSTRWFFLRPSALMFGRIGIVQP